MSTILNVEIKSPCSNAEELEAILLEHKAVFKGTDNQTDTYFIVPNGRLKLRQGNIENSLIFYNRQEVKGVKTSNVELVILDTEQAESMHTLLSKLHGIWLSVVKKRKIYFIENVKFHLDEVESLGHFVEIEAINFQNQDKEFLDKQCRHYMELLSIREENCIDASYSDLVGRTN